MLFWYFFKRFFTNFLAFFLILSVILAFSNVLVKAGIVGTWKFALKFFVLIFPFMSTFSIPIASGLAVQNVVGQMVSDEEDIFPRFFRGAQRSLFVSTAAFSLAVFFCMCR